MAIWERYFLKELLKVFILFLVVFYGLYVLIDYSSHLSSASHHHSKLHLKELFIHYLSEFLVRGEILVPFALMIATVKTLCQLNVHNEFVALLAAGYSKRRLLMPFIAFALFITSFMYINTEFFLPKATKRLQRLDEKYTREKPSDHAKPIVHHLVLEDGTTLLFRKWNQATQQFEKALWVRSIDEIWRLPLLNPIAKPPTGEYIDILKRNEEGLLTLNSSHRAKEIPEMRFNKKRLIETITPPDELALSALVNKLAKGNPSKNEKEARMLTAFYRKLVLPWLPLFAVLWVAPFCLHFTRQLPVFFIYAGSIFGLTAIYLTIDAATVLGERQVLQPAYAIFAPFTFFAALFIFRFLRMK